MSLNGGHVNPDPELNALFHEPAEQEVVDLLRSSRPSANPPLDPNFKNYLKAQLMTEARKTLPEQRRTWSWFKITPMPAFAAAAAALLIALGGIGLAQHWQLGGNAVAVVVQKDQTVDNKTDVAVAEPIKIPFSGPVDKNAVASTVEIEPATNYRTNWVGSTLVITPVHPLAGNTSYTVKLKPAAVPNGPQVTVTPAPTPVVVRFVTAPLSTPTVSSSAFLAQNLTVLSDDRLASAGAINAATWTPDGQLLVVRPSSAPSSSPSPSASPTGSPAGAAAPSINGAGDLWLMNPAGSYLREVASNGSLPSAAPSGGKFAFWRVESGNKSSLRVASLDGTTLDGTVVASVNGTQSKPAVWLDGGRMAFIDGGNLRVVDTQGGAVALPQVQVTGSMAASPDGRRLAVESANGPLIVDTTTRQTSALPAGATSFSWSPAGDLGFITPGATSSQLMVLRHDAGSARTVGTAPDGFTWSDLNWSPDSTSILLASQPSGGGTSHLAIVNADGSKQLALGDAQKEYASPRWSAQGDTVLFQRRDENGVSFWTLKLRAGALSTVDKDQLTALSSVNDFMDARLRGDLGTAQSHLGPGFDNKSLTLLAPGGQSFKRYYPVSVQLVQASSPETFLITVRLVLADSKTQEEVAFHEEILTVTKHGEAFSIDKIETGPTARLTSGPAVVSVEVGKNAQAESIMVRFDADLSPSSISGSTIYLRDSQQNTVALLQAPSYDQDNHLVTLSVKLNPGIYQLVVTTGLLDFNGKPMAQEYDHPIVINAS